MLVGWIALAGCIRDISPGPDLGPCAEIPEGTYGYGDAGIGSCLAGPADLEFFQWRGGTFLAVTNADPFAEFETGSVLIVDWDDLAARFLDAADRPDRVTMDQPVTHVVEILDDDDGDGDGENPFLGGFGYLAGHEAAIVASRFSENGILRSGRDEGFVLELKDMEQVGGGIELQNDTVQLEDDPFPVVVDSAAERVYIGNLSDHSVSVLRSDAPPPPGEDEAPVLQVVDVAEGPMTSEAPFYDADASGSVAEVSALTVTEPLELIEDQWTLTFVEQTVRLWVQAQDTDYADALRMYSTGDLTTWLPSVFPLELESTTDSPLVNVEAPFIELQPDGLPTMYYGDPTDGNISRALGASATGVGAPSGEWIVEASVLFRPDTQLGSPSLAPLAGLVGMYVDERSGENGLAWIARATSADGISFDYEGPVLEPPDGVSYEDPYVVFDPRAGRYRMWLSVRQADQFRISLSESVDGRTWSPPVEVIPSDGPYVYAAPTLTALEGRYGMFLSRSDGTVWDTAFCWSYDGFTWTEPELVVAGDPDQFQPRHPPRAGVLVDIAGAWRVEGANSGQLAGGLLAAGTPPLPITNPGTGQSMFELAVANGQEVENDVVPGDRAEDAMYPGSAVDIGGVTHLFVTTVSPGDDVRIAAIARTTDGWELAIDPEEMEDMLGVVAAQGASDPVVVQDADGYVLFYSLIASDGTARIRRATSADGLSWSEADPQTVLVESDDVTFDLATQRPHSVQVVGDQYRLWYTGYDGSTERIGSALSPSLRERFTRELGPNDVEWRLGTGVPGSFDDYRVKDPLAVEIDGQTHLYYAGNDGVTWRIGHAIVDDDGSIVARTDTSGLNFPAMDGLPRTFSAQGVDSPVLLSQAPEALELAYSGFDGQARRLGIARAPLFELRPQGVESGDTVFALQRFPTAGDLLPFSTFRGGAGAQVIELGQTIAEFSVPGWGMSSMALDAERGFLYVTTKLDDAMFVVDIRDDSDGSFVDANYLDLETLLQVDSGSSGAGYRDVVVSPSRGLAYLTQRVPDGLVIVDLSEIPDDADKELLLGTPVAVLPLQSLTEDAGSETVATIGGDGMVLTADERYLLVTHFRGNALSVFDLTLGAWGEEIAWLPNLGENPHAVRISPDGRWAVVANYQGDVTENTVSSTLTVIDLDPTSETYLEAVTWLANQ